MRTIERGFWFPMVLVAVALLGQVALVGAESETPITRVEAQRVCMVNDSVFPRDQIPVEVDGKTYFGCCEMCKGRLARDESVRFAVDPVTGAKVDKASAVIGATSDGKVLYFADEASFARYPGGT